MKEFGSIGHTLGLILSSLSPHLSPPPCTFLGTGQSLGHLFSQSKNGERILWTASLNNGKSSCFIGFPGHFLFMEQCRNAQTHMQFIHTTDMIDCFFSTIFCDSTHISVNHKNEKFSGCSNFIYLLSHQGCISSTFVLQSEMLSCICFLFYICKLKAW